MPSHTLDSLTLPDLVWLDEHDWRPVAQTETRSLSGALIVETGTMTGGRPITLAGADNYALTTRSVVDQLRAMAAEPGRVLHLTLADGRAFDVLFAADGIQARPLRLRVAYQATDPYSLTLNFRTV
ncbi:hypothetical protein [Chitinimonas koreensis]|uniref:hypothetical protein n=1 Tax=Chitinimonas koreensis TaxID=356302 RepID=UPI00040F092F|nr:hypothetical protein [Chitinimonas koreensis]QNM94898.1 hypothetical protein H9L41_13300 [Chitinimonas koreensis]